MKYLLLYIVFIAAALKAEAAPLFPEFPPNLVLRPGAHGTVALKWDANSETNIAGYFVKYGASTTNYTNSIWVGNTNSAVIEVGGVGTLYFAVTAVNSDGLESDPSNEVATQPRRKPSRPAMMRTAMISVPLEWTDNPKLGPWIVATNFPPMLFAINEPMGFYRAGKIEIELGPSIADGH